MILLPCKCSVKMSPYEGDSDIEHKGRTQQACPHKRSMPRSVTSFMMQQPEVGLPA